ncbi:MAG: MBG domain-containing protein [Gemmataceae bacterium]
MSRLHSLWRWFRGLVRPLGGQKNKKARSRKAAPTYRLRLEALEDRTLFAVNVLSVIPALTQTGNGQSEAVPTHSVSDDGRFVVYSSLSTDLVTGQNEPAATENVFLYDSLGNGGAGSTVMVSHQAGTTATSADGTSFNPVVSGDGSTIAFFSTSTNLISGQTIPNGTVQLYVYDVASGGIKLATHAFGAPISGASTGANGANPGVPPGPSVHWQNTLGYSVPAYPGTSGLGGGFFPGGVAGGLALPSLSHDGKYIVYIDDATNLGAANTGLDPFSGLPNTNVYLYNNNPADGTFGSNTLISHAAGQSTTTANGSAGGGGAYASTAAISADGSTVAFTDPGVNLVTGQSTDGVSDQLYVWHRTGAQAGTTVLASHKLGASLVGGTIGGSFLFGFTGDTPPSLSGDGSVVAYYFAGTDLVNTTAATQGTPSVLNVFRYDVASNTNDLVTHVFGDNTKMGDNPQNQIASFGVGPSEATGPHISSDGHYIAYANNSSNLLSTPISGQNGRDNVYLYDSTTHLNTLVNNDGTGSGLTPNAGGATAPGMSADGRFVTFMDLAAPATGSLTGVAGTVNVRLFDRQAAAGTQPTIIGQSYDATHLPPLTGTGSFVAATLMFYASALQPTVMSADGTTIVWSGPVDAHSMVSSVTDNNLNFDVFSVKNSTGGSGTSSTSTSLTITNTSNVAITTSTYGQSITLTATIVPTPAVASGIVGDTVTFFSGSTQLGTGTVSVVSGQYQASYVTSLVGAGNYTQIYAKYPGDSTTQPSQSTNHSLTVTPATLTYNANTQTKVYGDPNPSLTGNVTGLVNGETLGGVTTGTLTFTTTATNSSNVGNYAINGGGLTPNGNYVFAQASGNATALSITPKQLTYNATSVSRPYGSANPSLSGSVSGFVNGDTLGSATTGTLAFATTATTASNVGSYAITGSGLTANNGNYTFAQASGNATALTVTAATLAYVANSATKIYGDAIPTLSGSVTGLVNGDTLSGVTTGTATFSTTATAASNVGNYAITGSGLTLTSSNYVFGQAAGNATALTINPATLTYNANSATKVYGAGVPALSGNVSGLVNGDTLAGATTGTLAFSTTATPASNVGNYAITGGGLTANNGNYTFVQASGNATALSVTPATLTYVATTATKAYGASIPTLNGSVTGFVNGDTQASATTGTLAFSTTATSASNVGGYAVTGSGLTANNGNYTFVQAAGNATAFSITPATLAYTATPASRPYGSSNPALSGSVTGLVNGDTLSGVTTGTASFGTTATSASGAGSYAITGTGLTLTSSNYVLAQATANATALTINPVTLTYTATAASRAYGAANPALTGSVTGFVNGDTLGSATTGTLSFSTLANSTSGIGSYAVTGSGLSATNYVFAQAAANATAFSVTTAPLSIKANDKSKNYGQTISFAGTEFSATGLKNGETVGSVSLSSTGAAATASVAGSTYAIQASAATGGTFNASNYAITYQDGALTVNQAALTVKANDATKIVGQTVTFTGTEFSASGLQNGETIGSATITSAGAASAASTAGSPYTINISGATGGTFNAGNYAISYQTGLLFVSAAANDVYVSTAFNLPFGTPVNNADTDNQPATIGVNAFSSIQQAINAVAAGGTVHVASGTYAESLVISQSLTLQGTAAGFVVSGSGAGTGITVTGQTVAIAHVTVQGFGTGLVAGSTVAVLTLTDVHFIGNTVGATITGVPTFNIYGTDTAEAYLVQSTQITKAGENAIAYSGVANLNLYTLGGSDQVTITGDAAGTALSVFGGDGADVFDITTASGRLGQVLGAPVTLDGGTGSNQLIVDEAAATAGDVITVLANKILGEGPFPFTINYTATGGDFATGVQIMTGSSDDWVRVRGTAAQAPVSVLSGAGNDVIDVQAQSNRLGDVLAAPVALDAGAGNNQLSVSEANSAVADTVTVLANQILGQGAAPFSLSYKATGGSFTSVKLTTGSGADVINVTAPSGRFGDVPTGPISIDAGAGSNALNFSEANSPYGDVFTVLPTQIRGDGPLPFVINYTATGGSFGAGISVTGGSSDDWVRVYGLPAQTSLNVFSNAGNDVIDVAPLANRIGDTLKSPVAIDAGPGVNQLNVNEAVSTAGDQLILQANQVLGVVGAVPFQVNYGASGGTFSGVNVTTGASDDWVRVFGSPAAPLNVQTRNGNDVIEVAAQANRLGDVLAGAVSVDAGAGANSLRVSEAASAAGDVFNLTTNQIVGAGPVPFVVNFAASGGSFSGIVLTTGVNDDWVRFFSKPAAPVTIQSGAGNDVIDLSVSKSAPFNNLTVDGGAGNNIIEVFDQTGGAQLQTSPSSSTSGETRVLYLGLYVDDLYFQNVSTTSGIRLFAKTVSL